MAVVEGSSLADGVIDQFFSGWEHATSLPRFEHVPSALRDLPRVKRDVVQMWDNAAADGECLVHGASHVGKLYFKTDRRPGGLDWQAVNRGSWPLDFSPFLIGAVDTDVRREHEQA